MIQLPGNARSQADSPYMETRRIPDSNSPHSRSFQDGSARVLLLHHLPSFNLGCGFLVPSCRPQPWPAHAKCLRASWPERLSSQSFQPLAPWSCGGRVLKMGPRQTEQKSRCQHFGSTRQVKHSCRAKRRIHTLKMFYREAGTSKHHMDPFACSNGAQRMASVCCSYMESARRVWPSEE